MKQRIIPQSYATRLVTIGLMALFMASAVTAETKDRHRRSPAVSRQQPSANHRTSKNTRNVRPIRQGKRVAREDLASNHRKQRSGRVEKRILRADKTADRRDIRRGRNEKRTARADHTTDRRSYRRDRVVERRDWRERHEGRDTRYRHTYRDRRSPGFLSIFFGRPYYHSYRYNRYIPLTYRGHNYYYHNGSYYSYTGLGFNLVSGNIGFFLYSLPFGYQTLMIGGYPYYLANHHYYIRDYVRNVYVRVDDPHETSAWDDAGNDASDYQDLFVYPKQGQTEEEMKQDEYECYLWAVDQTGVDPSMGKSGNIEDYQRAKSACLEGRGYVVN